ncbi:MAG: DNA polymerase III subunit gamma/tau [Synergistaceae bacterium]|nr:DNA polymerase III subunit gamma/tau [Synergistaceae bacterium]
MSVSLYRKYRPQTFGDVYGQKTAIEIITNSIAKDRVGHAYLFSGSRGCGKTSVARIFAKALNCLEHQQGSFEPCGHCSNCTAITAGESLDVIEIDGASNNGVDNIRELKENVTLAPFTSKYKIYIVDEVHMLSQGAFNALLKTLEEPPEHVIFILATTEPHKVPVTIRSRCQHIPFHTISPEDIYKRLDEVCKLENITAEADALREIARQADGALRDALSLLEQVTAAGDITLANVEASFGGGSRATFERWITKLRTSPAEAYTDLKSMFETGASGVRVFEEIFALIRDLWLASKWQKITDSLGSSEPEKKFIREESAQWKPEKLHYFLNVANKILTQARMGIRNDILLGMFFMMLEPAPKLEAVHVPQQFPSAAPSHPPTPVAAPPAPKATIQEVRANDVEVDETLKENLLNVAREKNLVVYCGLFDARPYEKNGNLILDMKNRYCYEVLRQTKFACAFPEVFENYSSVILRFGLSEYTCPKFKDKNKKLPSSIENKTQVANKISEEALSDSVSESEYEIETEKPQRKTSAFDKFRNELALLQTRPEIIVIKHVESEQEEENNTNEVQEGESE